MSLCSEINISYLKIKVQFRHLVDNNNLLINKELSNVCVVMGNLNVQRTFILEFFFF